MKTQFPVEEIKESLQRRLLQAEKHMTNEDDDGFFTPKPLDRNQKGRKCRGGGQNTEKNRVSFK